MRVTVRTNGVSYAQYVQLTAGTQYVTPDPHVYVRVVNIDLAASTATVRLWNLPEHSVRKEDSNPAVYQIAAGHKRHITSPAELFALGYTWADVKSVPDGALNVLPTGAPLPVPTETIVPDVVEWPRVAAVHEITTAGLVAHLSGPTTASRVGRNQSPAAARSSTTEASSLCTCASAASRERRRSTRPASGMPWCLHPARLVRVGHRTRGEPLAIGRSCSRPRFRFGYGPRERPARDRSPVGAPR